MPAIRGHSLSPSSIAYILITILLIVLILPVYPCTVTKYEWNYATGRSPEWSEVDFHPLIVMLVNDFHWRDPHWGIIATGGVEAAHNANPYLVSALAITLFSLCAVSYVYLRSKYLPALSKKNLKTIFYSFASLFLIIGFFCSGIYLFRFLIIGELLPAGDYDALNIYTFVVAPIYYLTGFYNIYKAKTMD